MNCILEICVDSVGSAIMAQQAGADRIELCDNLMEGGTTPSFGCIVMARKNIDIPIHVLIRPRGGDFLYTGHELEIMKRDIEICGENGIDGIVSGILMPGGSVDVERTSKLAEMAYPMKFTFHRAFDMCYDPLSALEDVIATGASRLLTSGQKNTASEGAELIGHLVDQAGLRLIIMPGGGINETNVSDLITRTKACEIHLTGRKSVESKMKFRRDDISLGGIGEINEYSRKVADPEKIEKIKNILKLY